MAGLEDQLLALVVRKERADLAEERAQLIKQNNEFKIKQKELEDEILQKLANAEGDITEDVDLIEGLEKSKEISNEIEKKMAIAKKTQAEISKTSEKYRPVASRGALLFFIMNGLFRIHSYYMYSLNAFVIIFLRGIDIVSEKKKEPAKEILWRGIWAAFEQLGQEEARRKDEPEGSVRGLRQERS